MDKSTATFDYKEIANILRPFVRITGNITSSTWHDIVLANLDRIPDTSIDSLAQCLNVGYYDESANAITKRAFIKQSLDLCHKGTAYAVNNMLSIVAPGCHIEEWFNYNGKPYCFRIVEPEKNIINCDERKVIKAIESAKNVRSWLDCFVIKTQSVLNNRITGHISGCHTANDAINNIVKQYYWHDIYLRVKYDRNIKFCKSIKYNGLIFLDSKDNKQKHSADIVVQITPNMTMNTGFHTSEIIKNVIVDIPMRIQQRYLLGLTQAIIGVMMGKNKKYAAKISKKTVSEMPIDNIQGCRKYNAIYKRNNNIKYGDGLYKYRHEAILTIKKGNTSIEEAI